MHFDEKQNLGFNKSSLSLRMALAVFCFSLAWFIKSPGVNTDLLFLLGVFVLVISVVLLFITHLRTRVTSEQVILSRTFGSTKVEIPVTNIKEVDKVSYSRYLINYPVFNLHSNGTRKFYTGGSDAVLIVTGDGSRYLIGSQKAGELVSAIRSQLR